MNSKWSFDFISDKSDAEQVDSSTRQRDSDDSLLDAYSLAVTKVVDETIPSVIHVSGTERQGSGSGVLLSADGLAITNSHVVAGQLSLVATTSDGDRKNCSALGAAM